MTAWLPRLVARIPATVHTKLLVAFLAIVALFVSVAAVGLGDSGSEAPDCVDGGSVAAALDRFQRRL
ncbi:MAG: hypothetical protein ACRELA_02440 [Candidatus Rokuibacteriota bacterium]